MAWTKPMISEISVGKVKIIFSEESQIDNRLLSIKLNPQVERSNLYFIDILTFSLSLLNCLTDVASNLQKLKESEVLLI